MTPLFENVYAMTLDRYLAMADNPVGAAAVKALRRWNARAVMGMGMSVFLFAIGIYLRHFLFMILAVSLCSLFAYIRFWLRERRNKAQYKLICRAQTSDEWMRVTQFMPDEIVVRDANAQVHFLYTDFCRLSEDEEYFYLWRDQDLNVRLMKSCFVNTDDAAFRTFIGQKLGQESLPENRKETQQ